MKVRVDSIFKFANSYYDEIQEEYTWGIVDLPGVIVRDDDQFYVWRESDRLDAVSFKLLGDPRYMFLIMQYNNISDGMNMEAFIGVTLRIPSRSSLERVYLNA